MVCRDGRIIYDSIILYHIKSKNAISVLDFFEKISRGCFAGKEGGGWTKMELHSLKKTLAKSDFSCYNKHGSVSAQKTEPILVSVRTAFTMKTIWGNKVMKKIGVKRQHTNVFLFRLLGVLLCLNLLLGAISGALIYIVRAQETSAVQAETREEIKARLLQQIGEGWDPYSSDMSLDEFYALMELFEQGELPRIPGAATFAAFGLGVGSVTGDSPVAAAEDVTIPRVKFMFGGLTTEVTGSDAPLSYDNAKGTGDYPAGLDVYERGYLRPPTSWAGVPVDGDLQAVVIVPNINDGSIAIAGDVNQDLFLKYDGYYVKQVTISGANINILGMIQVNGQYICYYLSAEEQDTQVSTTTLPDTAKFVVEYVPAEHEIQYEVKMAGSDTNLAHEKPENVVFYGSNTPSESSWADSIFGAGRAHRTTDGAYSFDVSVPYGYTVEIYITIEMEVNLPGAGKGTFPVSIKHTGTKQEVHDTWLEAYRDYLLEEDIVSDEAEFNSRITETGDLDTGINLTWDETDPYAPAHDSVLARIAERINDFSPHNNGYPLGSYPVYDVKGPGGFKLLPNEKSGPTDHTMRDTFYNHLVKADRTVTAVLTPLPAPSFDVSQILKNSNGAGNRGSSATETFAEKSKESHGEDQDGYDADYLFHLNGGTRGAADDPLPHSADYPNVETADDWSWEDKKAFSTGSQTMWENGDGTYSYAWVFQTNTGDSFYLDALEVNGVALKVPYYPKYNWQDSYQINGKVEKADDTHPYYIETVLADGAILRVEFLLGWNKQRHYRISVTGARSNVVVTGLNLMQYDSGAVEFSVYNLTGVYSDLGGYSQTLPAIEYYSKGKSADTLEPSGWTRMGQANVVVDAIDYKGGDGAHYGANLRFKVADGYGDPYYIWADRHGDVIDGQTSLGEDGKANPIIPLASVEGLQAGKPGALTDEMLDSRYIYGPDADGYYYARVTTQSSYKIALLTVVAHAVVYTVRYVPEYTPGGDAETWYGFTVDADGELQPITQTWMNEEGHEILIPDPESMPYFEHDPEICTLWELAKDGDDVPPEYQAILHQYDDNDGPFYDLIYHTMATIASNTYGTVRPNDLNNKYLFVDWVVVGENFMPVEGKDGNPIQFLGGAIDFTQYARYAVKHTAFGNDDTDVHVLRLMPVWKQVNNPFTYYVVLNAVDPYGTIQTVDFSEYWNEVVTEDTIDDTVYVYLNKNARPIQDWIKDNSAYVFWDEVNNAVDVTGDIVGIADAADTTIEDALADYLKEGEANENYDNILAALTHDDFQYDGRTHPPYDAFQRMGKDVYMVTRDNGVISIWMFVDLDVYNAGLEVTKTVDGATDDEAEFRFTLTLSGTYTDSNGKQADAGSFSGPYGDLTFTNGVASFTLKDGESRRIEMLPPGATYLVEEVRTVQYTVSSTNAAGTLVSNVTLPVEFINKVKVPPLGYLVITEAGGKQNESFLYQISSISSQATKEVLIVSVKGGGETVVCVPLGKYIVEEITDWAWRYEDGECKQSMPVTVTDVNVDTNPAYANFTNDRNDKVWLGGENSKDIPFAGSSTTDGEQETASRRQGPTMSAAYEEEKKKQYDVADGA